MSLTKLMRSPNALLALLEVVLFFLVLTPAWFALGGLALAAVQDAMPKEPPPVVAQIAPPAAAPADAAPTTSPAAAPADSTTAPAAGPDAATAEPPTAPAAATDAATAKPAPSWSFWKFFRLAELSGWSWVLLGCAYLLGVLLYWAPGDQRHTQAELVGLAIFLGLALVVTVVLLGRPYWHWLSGLGQQA